jgi:hypothetical protein
MLNACSIYRLLIDDEQPVPPVNDPNQLALDFNPDELLDPKSEVMRYAEKPFRVAGSGPTDTFHYLHQLLGPNARRNEEGHPYRTMKSRGNTRIIDRGDRIVIRYHWTDVITAFPDGRVVFETGGWHPGGGRHAPGWSGEAGATTMDRMFIIGSTAGGWRIFKKDFVWYWYNPSREADPTVRYPFTTGDTVHPDGSLAIQAHPEYLKPRRRRA